MLNDLWSRLVAWTGTLVAPDWGALVALIPLLLLLVVGAFTAVTSVRWARIGPARRGPGRQLPVGPDGRSPRSPVLGPLVLAVGSFIAAFGVVAGPAWLGVGLVVAVAGLMAWRLEASMASRRARRETRSATTAS